MEVIADASSLIVLARQDGLWLLDRVFGLVGVVDAVVVETVDAGKQGGFRDAERIGAAITAGTLAVLEPTDRERRVAVELRSRAPALSLPDCLTLTCAQERRLLLLMEDRTGRRVAKASGIDYITLQVIALHGYIGERISFDQCVAWLTRIGQAMHTDHAVLKVLQSAAEEIRLLRDMKARDQE